MEYEQQDFKVEHQEKTIESWLEANPDSIVEDGALMHRASGHREPWCIH